MGIWALGINHKTAPVAVRERVAFDPASMPAVLGEVQALDPVSEVVILSTCNRTEIYCSADELREEVIVDWLVRHHHIDRRDLDSALYCLTSEQAVQ
ncbi:MAG: glutamyl-tRNA reductase, partial [Thalassolituus sp. CG17_big_fil_post_rev_8_21_14_2_50_53_8]